jgi:uncharacterized protein
MDHPATLVLGASLRTDRYSNLAISRLVSHSIPVVAVGLRVGEVSGVPVVRDLPKDVEIDTLTLYLNPHNQVVWSDRILELAPRRIIFNPGTEHPALEEAAQERGIEVVHGCTLVMLASGTY